MSIDNLQENEIDVQAKQIAGLLDAHAKRLSMRTLKQLENGRERAVKVHAQQISGVSVNRDGALSSISAWAEHHRMVSTGMLLAAIIAGFVVMQSLNKEPSDAFLLSADLPPEAFVDRGFEPYLNDSQAKL
jgi:Protein of unknown function (DUF3619)